MAQNEWHSVKYCIDIYLGGWFYKPTNVVRKIIIAKFGWRKKMYQKQP